MHTCKKRSAAQCFARRKDRNSALHSGSLYASTPKSAHRYESFLHFDIGSIWKIRSSKYFSSARCLLPANMLKRWLHVCHVKITFTLLLTNRLVSTTTDSMSIDLFNSILKIRKIRCRIIQFKSESIFCDFCDFPSKIELDTGTRLEMIWKIYPIYMRSCVKRFPF